MTDRHYLHNYGPGGGDTCLAHLPSIVGIKGDFDLEWNLDLLLDDDEEDELELKLDDLDDCDEELDDDLLE